MLMLSFLSSALPKINTNRQLFKGNQNLQRELIPAQPEEKAAGKTISKKSDDEKLIKL
jgi:hypothetical protein